MAPPSSQRAEGAPPPGDGTGRPPAKRARVTILSQIQGLMDGFKKEVSVQLAGMRAEFGGRPRREGEGPPSSWNREFEHWNGRGEEESGFFGGSGGEEVPGLAPAPGPLAPLGQVAGKGKERLGSLPGAGAKGVPSPPSGTGWKGEMLDKIGSPSLFSQEEESDVPIAQDEWDPAPLQPSSDQQKSVHCVVPIQAPAARSGGGWDCVPRRTLEDWCPRLNHLAAGSLAPATRQKYEGALRDYWAWFLGQRPLGGRYDEEGALVAFVLWAKGEGKAWSWAVARLAAVAFVSKVEGRPDCSRSFLVRKMLAGWGRMAPALPDQRKPITVEMLFRLCDALPLACHSQGEAALFKCSFLFAFFGALRVSEFTTLSKLSPSGAVIQFPSCRISEREVSFSIPRSKTDQMGRGSRVTLKASPSSPLCPVRALRVFLMFRPPSALPLFVHQDGSPVTRYQFSFMLRRALAITGIAPDGSSSHSFRIGAATAAHAAGLGVPAVQAIGRWKSSAYKSYVRAQALGWGQ